MLYLETITCKPTDMSFAQESLKEVKRIASASSNIACMLINRVGIKDVVIGWVINQIGIKLGLSKDDPILEVTVADIVNQRFKEALATGFTVPFVVDSFLLPIATDSTDGTYIPLGQIQIPIEPKFDVSILECHPRLRVLFTKQNQVVFSLEYIKQSEASQKSPIVLNPDYSIQMMDNFGNIYANPDNFIKALQERQKIQDSLANKQKGSSGYSRALDQLSQLDSRISNIAIDTWHKAAKQIVQQGRPIVVVQINRKGMSDLSLNKSVYASNGFIRVLQIKAQTSGVPFISVPWANILAYMAQREQIIPTVAADYAAKYPKALMSALVAFGSEWNTKK